MRYFHKFLFLLAIIFSTTPLSAAPRDQVATIFADHFNNHYQSGRCGTNVANFFQDLEKSGADLSKFYMLSIENDGFSGFGMVNVEAARDYIRDRWESSEKNWYHHVIAVNTSGEVYDFDFTIRPKIVPVADYVETMFLNETECQKKNTYGEFCIGRDVKLNEYSVRIIPARDFIRDHSGKKPDDYPSVSLKKLRDGWRKHLKVVKN